MNNSILSATIYTHLVLSAAKSKVTSLNENYFSLRIQLTLFKTTWNLKFQPHISELGQMKKNYDYKFSPFRRPFLFLCSVSWRRIDSLGTCSDFMTNDDSRLQRETFIRFLRFHSPYISTAATSYCRSGRLDQTTATHKLKKFTLHSTKSISLINKTEYYQIEEMDFFLIKCTCLLKYVLSRLNDYRDSSVGVIISVDLLTSRPTPNGGSFVFIKRRKLVNSNMVLP